MSSVVQEGCFPPHRSVLVVLHHRAMFFAVHVRGFMEFRSVIPVFNQRAMQYAIYIRELIFLGPVRVVTNLRASKWFFLPFQIGRASFEFNLIEFNCFARG